MKKNHGFTLIELLIAMAVGLVVLGAVYSVFIVQNKELNKQEQIAVMQQNARMAMEMMTKEIMMAGYGPSGATRCTGTNTSEPSTTPYCLGIAASGGNTVSFSYYNNNTPPTQDNITYSLYTPTGGVQTLGRKINGSLQPAVEYVSALNFTYLDEAGATTTNLKSSEPRGNNSCTGSGAPYSCCTGSNAGTCNGIRTIQITITTQTANIDPDLGTVRTHTLTSYVTPRNLGLTGY